MFFFKCFDFFLMFVLYSIEALEHCNIEAFETQNKDSVLVVNFAVHFKKKKDDGEK